MNVVPSIVVPLRRRARHQREKKRWRETDNLFEWRDAVRSECGPRSPVRRLVLLTLSLWINPGERQCWPSQQTLARQTALSLRAVKDHLQLADDEGWIFRTRKRAKGKVWAQTYYELTIPVDPEA